MWLELPAARHCPLNPSGVQVSSSISPFSHQTPSPTSPWHGRATPAWPSPPASGASSSVSLGHAVLGVWVLGGQIRAVLGPVPAPRGPGAGQDPSWDEGQGWSLGICSRERWEEAVPPWGGSQEAGTVLKPLVLEAWVASEGLGGRRTVLSPSPGLEGKLRCSSVLNRPQTSWWAWDWAACCR